MFMTAKQQKDFEFDLALEVLNAVRRPHERLSLEDIAAVCGVKRQTILNIERRALRRLWFRCKEQGIKVDSALPLLQQSDEYALSPDIKRERKEQ